MHTCPPPINELKNWLEEYPSSVKNYGHLLLEQKSEYDSTLVHALRRYFESAHFDARHFFHKVVGIDLHPDAEGLGAHACYPNCLPGITRKGLFGEVLAGLITESYDYIGNHKWEIPVFLFRHHNIVEQYMFNLLRDKTRNPNIPGRFGSDFIGLSLGDDGSVVRFISGEAKWRKILHPSVINQLFLGNLIKDSDGNKVHSGKGIWYKLNNDVPVPHGLQQLQRILKEIDPEGFSAVILSLDKVLTLNSPTEIPRTNLILIAGNNYSTREKAQSLIQWEDVPSEYTRMDDLQVVEVIMENGEQLIDAIYDSLWQEG